MSQNVYSIVTNFGNDFSLRQFYAEIRDENAIDDTKLSNIDVEDDVVTVDWNPALSGPEETALAGIISGWAKDDGRWVALPGNGASGDYGFFGSYIDTGVTKYSGFFRNPRTGKMVFFDNVVKEPIKRLDIDETVTSGVTYAPVAMKQLEIKVDDPDIEEPIKVNGLSRGDVLVSKAGGGLKRIAAPTNLEDYIFVTDETNADIGVSFGEFDTKVFKYAPFAKQEFVTVKCTIDNVNWTVFRDFLFNVDRSGKYRFGIVFKWRYTPTNRKISVRGILDGTDIIFNSQENRSTGDPGTTNLSYVFGDKSRLTSGPHSFQLQFRTEDFGDEACIVEASFEFERKGKSSSGSSD